MDKEVNKSISFIYIDMLYLFVKRILYVLVSIFNLLICKFECWMLESVVSG